MDKDENCHKTKSPIIFGPESYTHIGIDQLLTYASYRVLIKKETCTFERLVYECFILFPLKFGFQRYPQWPDSARINKAWLRCRTDKGWLAGNIKEGFRLTPAGEVIARKTERELTTEGQQKELRQSTKSRERYEAILMHIKASPEFGRYLRTSIFDLSVSELRSFLGGTLETPKRILRHNLNQYFQASEIYKELSIEPFLQSCKKMLSTFQE